MHCVVKLWSGLAAFYIFSLTDLLVMFSFLSCKRGPSDWVLLGSAPLIRSKENKNNMLLLLGDG